MKNTKKILALVLVLSMLIGLAACGKDNSAYYKDLAGDYYDSVSQRAMATVTAEDDHVSILISWANSAVEVEEWNLTAKLNKDGVLEYSDAVETLLTYDDKGEATTEELVKDGKGYFTVKDGQLLWDGASDEVCKACVFEKIIAQ